MKLSFFLILLLSTYSLQFQFIEYKEIEDQISIITINRPKALNALNSKVLEELDLTLESIDTSKIRAVIITGSGEKSFVEGLTLRK